MQDELIDLVDGNNIVVETIWRSQTPEDTLPLYVRCVLIFLKNKEGKICFLRRTADKSFAPNHWALVGGAMQSGEHHDLAAERETEEEVNISMQTNPTRLLGMVTPFQEGGKCFKYIYEIELPSDHVPFNVADFSELLWIEPANFIAHVANSQDQFCADLVYLVNRFYLPELL